MNIAPCTLKFPGDEQLFEFTTQPVETIPMNARQCGKGGYCTPVADSGGTFYCTKCGKDMGPGVAPGTPKIDNAHSMAPRTTDVVLSLKLTAADVQRLLASIVTPGQVFRNREEVEQHLLQEIVLSIVELEPSENQVSAAKQMIAEHMPELSRHL